MACNCEGNTYNLQFGCVKPVVVNPNIFYTKDEIDEMLDGIIASGCCISPEEVDEKISAATSGYATEQWVDDQGYLTEHQPLKTINGESLVGEGDITISGGDVDLSDYYTKQEIDEMLDDNATKTWILGQGYASNSELIQYVNNLQQQINSLIASISGCCAQSGETQYRWITMTSSADYWCDGTTKKTLEKQQSSSDGLNWVDTGTIRSGSTILETDCVECGYPSSGGSKLFMVDSTGGTQTLLCNCDGADADTCHTLAVHSIKNLYYDNGNETTIVTWPINTSAITNVTLGDCVHYINTQCFNGYSSLSSITFPNTVIAIRDGSVDSGAFSNCTSLSSVTLPNSLEYVGALAFYGCTALKSAYIGSGIVEIGTDVFKDCSSLESVTINSTTPPRISYGHPCPSDHQDYTFVGNYTIYVPQSAVETYKTAWPCYADRIQAIQ